MICFQSMLVRPSKTSISRKYIVRPVEKQARNNLGMTTLRIRLKEAREEKGWKKADLQRAAGLKSASTLTELEKGEIEHTPQLPAIASALGVEVLWLKTGKGPKYRPEPFKCSARGRLAAQLLDSLRQEDQVAALHYLHAMAAFKNLDTLPELHINAAGNPPAEDFSAQVSAPDVTQP